MEVKCPQCDSRFNLPDRLAQPGAKLRCTVCKNVFTLPAYEGKGKQEEPAPLSAPAPQRLPEMPKAGSRSWVKGGLLLLCVILIGAAGGAAAYYFYFNRSSTQTITEEADRNVALLTMRNVRQYNIPNEKIGKVFVIEGKVVNEFPTPRDFIELEGAIYDKDKKPIAIKKQLAGTHLSFFQLQVLNEKEMESFLNNKIEILANNTNVPTGGEVPFMILFFNPPDSVSEFGVKIVDAKSSANAVNE